MAKVFEAESVDWIVDQAAGFLGVKPADIKKASAHSTHRDSWRIAAYAACEISGRSVVEIGRVLGGVDHSRIIGAREVVRERIAMDPEFRTRVSKLLKDLRMAKRNSIPERGSLAWIVEQAAGFLAVKPADIKTASSRSKHRESWLIAAYVVLEASKRSAVEIGQVLGGVSRFRIIAAREMVQERMAKDRKFNAKVTKLLENLRVALF